MKNNVNPQDYLKKGSKNKKYFIGIFVALVIAILVTVVPLPYYLEVPGSAEKLTDVVTVDGKKDENKGAFMLTTVGIQQASAAQLLVAKFSDFTDIMTKEELFGTSTDEAYNRMQENYMTSSQNAAMQVALDLADIPYTLKYQGIYVMDVTAESSFKDKLEIGYIVTSVDGQTFESTDEFMTYVASLKVGDKVTITYERDAKAATTSGKLIKLESTGKAGIGISLTDNTEIEPSVDIKFATDGIGGPSAGLMFTLETYSLLSQKDLRRGHLIAGTGTIAADGTVGRIGGIDKKVVAATNEKAEIFFAPDDEITDEMLKYYPDMKSNYQEALAAAKKIKSSMKIVPVKTVQDALDYLATLEEK